VVLCTGSIAFDYILTFKGRFRDHILLDKTHILNLSFLVDDLQKRRGGVAGNYAYNLSLLGHPAAVLATAGTDATDYRDWLIAQGVDCQGLRLRRWLDRDRQRLRARADPAKDQATNEGSACPIRGRGHAAWP